MTAIGTFRGAKLRVHAVGFGTPGGATIPEREADGTVTEHRDWAGRAVVTQLREDNLRDIARLTGGTYVRWTDEGSVRPIAVELARVRARARAASAGSPRADRFQWPLAFALAALAAEDLVSRRTRRRR
jgi:hypothetical protein